MNTRPPHVGLTIKARRIAQAMTRAELSRASGLSVPHLYRIETGARCPSEIALVKIARAFGCAAKDLRQSDETTARA